MPCSIDEPTKASWYLSVTTDANGLCTVTASLPPSPSTDVPLDTVQRGEWQGVTRDKRPQRSGQNQTDLMPNSASCKRWDTLAFSGRSRARCLRRSWHPSRYRQRLSVHRSEPWASPEDYRLADAMIDKRLPERPIIGPSGKDFVDGRIVNGWLALGVLRHG